MRPVPLGQRALGARLALPLGLAAAYLATRLFHLGLLPMASDEGTYITWGVRALHARGWEDWLASLEDGKQPLLAWLIPPFLALLSDRLVAGRLVSVLCGLANLFLLVALGRTLRWPRAGWLAAALYVVAPIALVHDRMALYDSLVATTALAVLSASLAWAERPSWRRTVWLGLAVGGALLTKLSALFFVALVPVAVLIWRPVALRRWWRLVQAGFLAAAIYSVLYLSPIVGNIEEGNFQRYSLTLGEVLQLPWAIWWRNAVFVWEAATTYLGWPLALIAAGGAAWAVLRAGRGGWLVALWLALPLLAFVLTAKIIYSRYVVFCFVVAMLPAAALLLRLPRIVGAVAGLAILVPCVAFAVPLLGDPATAPWMNDSRYITDRFQYVESNYAGYGLRQIVDYVRDQAAQRPVVVLTRASTGMPRDGVTAYLLAWPNVQIGFVGEQQSIEDRLSREPDAATLLAARGADVYYILTDAPNGEQEQRFLRLNPGLTPLIDVPKPADHSRFKLFKTRFAAPDAVWLDPPASVGADTALLGYRLSPPTVLPGGTVHLTLFWRAVARPDRDYTVFNHVEDASGRILGQLDSQPGGGRRPTSLWRAGDVVGDVYEIPVKPDAPPGTYDLQTGMYELATLRRLPIHLAGRSDSDHLVLGQVRVIAG